MLGQRSLIIQLLNNIYNRTVDYAERITSGNHWAFKVMLLSLLVSLFFAFPSYDGFDISTNTWNAALHKSKDISYNLLRDFGPGSNEVKLNFRITVPLFAGLLGLGPYGMYALQFICGVLIFYLIARISEDIVLDRVTALFITLMVASIFAGSTAFVELRGLFDAVSIFLLLFAIYFKNPIIIIIAVFLAGWNDERGLIASSLVFLYFIFDQSGYKRITLVSFFSFRPILIMIAWAVYFISRFIYSSHYNIPTLREGTGLGVLISQINMIPMGIWSALEGGWLLIGFSIMMLFHSRRWLALMMFVGALGVILLVALSVVDVSRSAAYALPSIFIALLILRDSDDLNHLRFYCFIAMLLSLIWPAYYAGGVKTIWWQYPFPIQVIRWLFI